MKTVHLPERWTEELLRLPESGMGYQRVNIILRHGKVLRDIVVLNAEEAQAPESFEPSDIVNVELVH